MFYKRKVGNKKKEQGKDPYTIFLDKDIQYPVSGKDGQLTGQVRKVTNLEKLNEVINQSLKDYPRDFLLPNTKKAEMDTVTYNHILKKYSKKDLHQNLLRKIYVYYWYNSQDHRIPYDTMEKIAEYMRHDVGTAVKDYLKVNVPEYTGKPVEIYVPPLPKTVERPAEKKVYFDPSKYGKKWREDNKEKIKVKRNEKYKGDDGKYSTDEGIKVLARKIVWYLNTGGTKQPKKSSIDTYKLVYDEVIKQWKSELF